MQRFLHPEKVPTTPHQPAPSPPSHNRGTDTHMGQPHMDLLIIKLLPDTHEKNLHLLHTPAQRSREKPHPDTLQPPLQRLHLEHARLLESAILGPAPDRQLKHLVVDVRFGEAGSDELLLHHAHVFDVETGFHRAFGQVLEEFHDEGGAGDGVVVGDGGGF